MTSRGAPRGGYKTHAAIKRVLDSWTTHDTVDDIVDGILDELWDARIAVIEPEPEGEYDPTRIARQFASALVELFEDTCGGIADEMSLGDIETANDYSYTVETARTWLAQQRDLGPDPTT